MFASGTLEPKRNNPKGNNKDETFMGHFNEIR